MQTDQVLGGGTLWVLGDVVGFPFLAAQIIQLMREDAAEAAQTDAELDATETRPGQMGRDEKEEAGPWWHDDPRFTDRFKPIS